MLQILFQIGEFTKFCMKRLADMTGMGRHLRLIQSSGELGSPYRTILTGNISAHRHVPKHIAKPPYVGQSWLNLIKHGFRNRQAEVKTAIQINKMRDSCSLARDILNMAGELVKPGITTNELDAAVHEACIRRGAYPSPLLYKNFPKSVCTSVNNVACHGIPDDLPLQRGDIINIDVTVRSTNHHEQ